MTKEYELQTQGARYSFEPPYDDRDPMRNRPYEHCAQIAEQYSFSPGVGRAIAKKIRAAEPKAAPGDIRRYDLGREFVRGAGVPAIVECECGAYVRYEDHEKLLAAAVAHSNLQMALRRQADERLAKSMTTLLEELG